MDSQISFNSFVIDNNINIKKFIDGLKSSVCVAKDSILKLHESDLSELIELFNHMQSEKQRHINAIYLYMYTQNDQKFIEELSKVVQEFSQWYQETVLFDKCLYKKVCEVCSSAKDLPDNQQRFIKDLLRDFEHAGAALGDEEKAKLLEINQMLLAKGIEFSQNIQNDSRGIWVEKKDLVGLDEDFIGNLKSNDGKKYFLGVDYPTYYRVLEECEVEETRKLLFLEYNKRGYPANESLLKEYRQLMSQKAYLLGYKTPADLDIEDTMAKKVSTVQDFIDSLYDVTVETARIEKEKLLQFAKKYDFVVPIDGKGTVHPWNSGFISNKYKKEAFKVDGKEIQKYFPVKRTLEELLSLYEEFFSISMKKSYDKKDWWWADDLIEVEVYQGGKLYGTLVLDLYPRDGKYTHACSMSCIQGQKDPNGNVVQPCLNVVLANFPRPVNEKPGLLSHNEVTTFFHEFGHALHAILGIQEISAQSGTAVDTDFVEVPSQLFEQWMWEPEILQRVSGHYKTGDPLPKEIIDNMCAARTYAIGMFYQRQIALTRISLMCYTKPEKNIADIKDESYKDIVSLSYRLGNDQDKFECSFGHLTGYLSKYYSYAWSIVYAFEIFNYVKKHGLLNKKIGEKVKKNLLMPGASKDPMVLIESVIEQRPSMNGFKDFIKKT